MRLEAEWKFGEFRLDPAERHVWHGETLVPLRPKLFAALSYLVEHAGRLITREELLRAIWSRTHVDETLLRGTMRDLRSALGDDAGHPQFIETVPHQGYRFVAAVTRVARPDSRDTSPPAVASLVERGAELDKLERALERALDRRRQVVLITGDAGMGKTALVDAWTSGLSNRNGVLVARGQCVEQYGAAEAFLPILEAVAQAGRGRSGKRVLATLAQYAPTWLVQLPSLLTGAELDRLQRTTQGAGRDRMLREMAEAIEALSVEMPIALLLEDLHWSDPSTVDVLGMLARRREPARLLVLGTYRPADVIITGHPMRTLKQELHARGLCEEIALEFLTPAGVAEYLDARFGGTRAAAARREGPAADHADRPRHELATLARLVHRRSDGNPLFVVTMVDYLVDREAIRLDADGGHPGDEVGELENGVPEGLKQLIERQLERLAEADQQLLQAASVAGVTFTSTAVAAALDVAVDQVDERCDRLVGRGQFLDWHHAEALPDGVAASHYRFRHALYQQVLYARLSSGRLARLHRRIGDREEAAWGARASEHAAALAMHFERAHDDARALPYLAHVAKSAMARSAFQESLGACERGLALLEPTPAGPARRTHELTFALQQLAIHLMTSGYASTDSSRTVARVRQLLTDPGETDPVQLAFLELLSLGRFDYVRGHLDAAAATGRRCIAVAPAPDHPLALGGHTLLCCVCRQRGDFRDAVGHAEEVARHYDARVHGRLALDMTDDPFIVTRTYAGDSLAALGRVEEARAQFRAASEAAVTLGIPFCAAFAPMSSTYGHLTLQDVDAARQALDTVDALSTQHGFAYLLGNAASLRGWLETLEGCARDRTRQERLELVARFETGLQAYEANGIVIGRAVLQAWFALAVHQSGDTERALRIVDEAIRLAEGMGAFGDAMPPHLIKGDLSAASGRLEDALASYEHVSALAQRSAARLFELMAATRLVRLSRTAALAAGRVNSSAASARLAAICDWFTEGVDIQPLREARALLAASPSPSARRPRTRR